MKIVSVLINKFLEDLPQGQKQGENSITFVGVSEHIFKRNNKSLLLYHLFCPIKYRRSVLSEPVENSLVAISKNISERYEIHFVEIGADENHVHFLIQSVPEISVETIVRTVKSITAKEIFRLHPEVKNKLWGGNFGRVGII